MPPAHHQGAQHKAKGRRDGCGVRKGNREGPERPLTIVKSSETSTQKPEAQPQLKLRMKRHMAVTDRLVLCAWERRAEQRRRGRVRVAISHERRSPGARGSDASGSARRGTTLHATHPDADSQHHHGEAAPEAAA